MSAFNAFNTALYSRLTTTAALTALLASPTSVYFTQAPDTCTTTGACEAALPYVVWNWQAGGGERVSAHRTKDFIVFIRAYSAVSASDAGNLDAQIDAALDMKPLTLVGWTNFWLARGQEFASVEIDAAARKIWMAGAYYRVRLDNA